MEDLDKTIRENIRLLMKSRVWFKTQHDLAPAFSKCYGETVTADWIGNLIRDPKAGLSHNFVRAVTLLFGVSYEELETRPRRMLSMERERLYADALIGLTMGGRTRYLITSRRLTFAAVPPEVAHAWHALRFAAEPWLMAAHDTLSRTVHDSYEGFGEAWRPRITNRISRRDWEDTFYYPAQPGVTREHLLSLLAKAHTCIQDCELRVVLHHAPPADGLDTEFIVTSDPGAGQSAKLLLASKRGDYSGVVWTTARAEVDKAYATLRHRAAAEGGTEVGAPQIDEARQWIDAPHKNPAHQRQALSHGVRQRRS